MENKEKPKPEQYGWHSQNGFDDESSGWMIEGGEEAYYRDLQSWEIWSLKKQLQEKEAEIEKAKKFAEWCTESFWYYDPRKKIWFNGMKGDEKVTSELYSQFKKEIGG